MNKNKFSSFIPALVFLMFIFGMSALFLMLPKKDYSDLEKKYLSKPAEFSIQALLDGSFGQNFENYLSDHTAGRQFYVGLNSYYTKGLGNNCINGIYSGYEGYLINEPHDITQFDKNIRVIDSFAKKTDIPVSVLVVPNTGYIMENKLPPVHNQYKDKEQFEQMEKFFGGNYNISFANITDDFRNLAGKGKQLYYKTDHHWTTYGAYKAYEKLSHSLDFEAVPLSSYVTDNYEGFYGTCFSTSGLWFTEPDTISICEYKGEQDISVEIQDGETTIKSDSLYFKNHLDELDMYPVFIDGNHPFTRITNNNAQNSEKLLIFKDSFAHAMTPFLIQNYSEIVLIDIRYYKNDLTQFFKDENFSNVLFLYGLDTLSTDTNLVYLEALVSQE